MGWQHCYDEIVDCYNHIGLVTIIVYIIAIITVICVLPQESQDVNSVYIDGKWLRGYRMGAPYHHGKPRRRDTVRTLLEKIRLSSRYEVNSVKWRRCILFAIIAGFVLLSLLFYRLPTGQELIIAVIVLYLFSYIALDYYQQNIADPAVDNITKATRYIADKYGYY